MKPTEITLHNGEKLPFAFGMAALSNFLDEEGMTLNDLSSLQENLTLSRIVRIIYAGFRDGHRREKLPFTLTHDDIADLLDENPALMTRSLEIFAQSMPTADAGNGNKPAVLKKKAG
jgi:hypothetical protein